MTSFVVSVATTTAKAMTAGEAGLVTATGSIFTNAAHSITVDGGGTLAVAGSVMANSGFDAAIFNNAGDTHLTVSSTGLMTGLHGVTMAGTTGIATIDNDGMLSGQSSGVSMLGSQGKIVNSGHIAGFASTGVYAGVSGNLFVSNTGSIDGSVYGVYRYNAGSTTLVNMGTITGSFQALRLDAGVDVVTNSGTLSGTVVMGAGDDIFRGQHGVQDDILGEAGNDQLLGGHFDDMLDGGIGNDSVRGFGDDDKLLGGDGNDLIYGGAGDDNLAGGAGIDQLYGNDGDDVLSGGIGNDRLIGGRGNDTLAGDAGTDTFVFAAGGGDDLVQGFADNVDVMDLRYLGLASLADLKAHASDITLGLRIDLHDFGSGTIVVQGLTLATLTAQDVLL